MEWMAHPRGPDPNTRPPDPQDHPDAPRRPVSGTCQGVPSTTTFSTDAISPKHTNRPPSGPPIPPEDTAASITRQRRCSSSTIGRPAARRHHQKTPLRASLANAGALPPQSAAQWPADTTRKHRCEHHSPTPVLFLHNPPPSGLPIPPENTAVSITRQRRCSSSTIRRPAARRYHQKTPLRVSLANAGALPPQSAAQRPADTTRKHRCEHHSPTPVLFLHNPPPSGPPIPPENTAASITRQRRCSSSTIRRPVARRYHQKTPLRASLANAGALPPQSASQRPADTTRKHRCEHHSPTPVLFLHNPPPSGPPIPPENTAASITRQRRCSSSTIRRPAARRYQQKTPLRVSLANAGALPPQSAAQRPADTTRKHRCEHHSPTPVLFLHNPPPSGPPIPPENTAASITRQRRCSSCTRGIIF